VIKDNQRVFNRIHVLLDAVIVAFSYILAWFMKFNLPFLIDEGAGVLPMATYMSALYFLVPSYIALYYAFNMYAPKRATRRKYELIAIMQSNTVGLLLFIVVLFVLKQNDFSRQMIVIFYALNISLTMFIRSILRSVLQFFRRRRFNLKYVLLVGYSHAAEAYITRIMQNPQWGYVVRAILDDYVPRGTVYKGVKVVGRIDNLHYILPENKLDEIAITLPLSAYSQLENIIDLCEKSGVHTKFIPDYTSLVPSLPYIEDLMGLPVINIRNVPLTNTFNRVIKRVIDIVSSIVGLVVFSPFMLIAALAIRLTSRGPII
jgi:FlaA1/EpsC-like NDP-sugar epimerase